VDVNQDYKDLFKILNTFKVRYLVVGAYAVTFYTEPRFTKDIDVWVEASEENAKRLYEALADFGAPLKGISVRDFVNEKIFYQIGIAPVRIDIITGLKGLRFKQAWKNRKNTKYGGIPINILGIKDLVRSKRKVARAQDILDLKKLTRRIPKR
jgi:predicted nucleotidyltransferase